MAVIYKRYSYLNALIWKIVLCFMNNILSEIKGIIYSFSFWYVSSDTTSREILFIHTFL